MSPEKGQKRAMNKGERKYKNPSPQTLNREFKKQGQRRGMPMDVFTPEGIPVTSPLSVGINFTSVDAY